MKKKSLIALGVIAGAAIMLAGCSSSTETPESVAPSETPVVESQLPEESLPPVNTEFPDYASEAPVDESQTPDEAADDEGLTAPTETPAE